MTKKELEHIKETIKTIKKELREIKKYMREHGIKKMSCFNGGHTPESSRCNTELFRLNSNLSPLQNRLNEHERIYGTR